ncbi:hypothetical protein [Pseudoalteromonas luteoviolacea]|uniref:Phage protein n=1 Tax=Pseudoalteromonas luteoviolacea S4060-1 TaxID=1365257 RepID=A0A167JJG9_9GAMM|nr:hypothetical protein [Pseudoalteromonas luteoviolacea]KZN61205.1 hypothetical protein N478_05695 [Pseudoalteromonas luteoviolacea S4060-1]
MANQIATWLNKGYAEKLVKAATGYWNKTSEFVMWAVNQKDEQQNEEPILSFLAWERLTDRLHDEPLELYRKRVQHALVNTIDAGEFASIKDIFARLGIEVIKVSERLDGRDWDIIAIDLTDNALANNNNLLPELIQLYGRTCRRYELTVHNKAEVSLSLGGTHVQWDNCYVPHALHLQANNQATQQYSHGFISLQNESSTTPVLPLKHDVEHLFDMECLNCFLGLDNRVVTTSLLPTDFNVQHSLEAQPKYGFISKEGGVSQATL